MFTAGACPLNAAGEIVSRGDLAAQTKQAMDNLDVEVEAVVEVTNLRRDS
jgi:enamine deaminase RidA (YjgF/YER057c/UK114 family)